VRALEKTAGSRFRSSSIGQTLGNVAKAWYPFAFWLPVYLVLSLLAYGPALRYAAASLPCGKPTLGVVALFNAWSIWWNADRLKAGLVGYWDAPIFWPEHGTFAFSEPQPLSLIVAPVVWAAGPMMAYHAYFLLSLWLNGLLAARLLRRLGCGWWGAGLGGALVVWLPLVHRQPEMLQFVPLWPVLLMWTGAIRLLSSEARWHTIVEFAAGIVLTFMACVHYGVFSLLLLVPAFLVVLLPTTDHGLKTALQRSVRVVWRWVIGLMLAGVIVSAVYWPMYRILRQHEFTRSPKVVQALSARPEQWLAVPPEAYGGVVDLSFGVDRPLHPGWLRLVLAVVGAVVILTYHRKQRIARRGIMFLVVTAFLAVVASLGRNLALGEFRPWDALAIFVPGIAQVRSPYRFAYLAQLAVLLLTGAGFDVAAVKLLNARTQGLRPIILAGRPRVIAVTLLSGLMIGEVPPPRVILAMAPDLSHPPGWVTFLTQNRETNEPVLILDFPSGGQLVEYHRTVSSMLWQTQFRLPLVNGYAGFFPRRWSNLASVWRVSPYSHEAFRLLQSLDVRILVRPSDFPPPPEADLAPFHLELLMRDATGVEVYRLAWEDQSVPIR